MLNHPEYTKRKIKLIREIEPVKFGILIEINGEYGNDKYAVIADS